MSFDDVQTMQWEDDGGAPLPSIYEQPDSTDIPEDEEILQDEKAEVLI